MPKLFQPCLTQWDSHDGFAEIHLDLNGRFLGSLVIDTRSQETTDAIRDRIDAWWRSLLARVC